MSDSTKFDQSNMQSSFSTYMVGKKFGRLLVVSQAQTKHKRARWNCQCDCGNLCVAVGKDMRQGKKRSCGCLRRELSALRMPSVIAGNLLPPGEAAFNLLYASYRCASENRALSFDLTKEEFGQLTKRKCFYCGLEPSQVCRPEAPGGSYIYSGVDRRDNSVGYTLENCVSCCKLCNWMKNKFEESVFLEHCALITSYQNRKDSNV